VEVRPVLPTSRSRVRVGIRLLAGVLALALVAVAVLVVVQRQGGDGSPSAGSGTTPPTEHAITVALATSSGDVTGLSLLAAGADDAQQVLVPSRLLLDVPGAGRIALTGSLVPGPQAPGQALADALGVRIDATWALNTAALAALVDKVGGVVVNVDTDITRGTAPGAAVLIGAGPNQKLNGEQAARFAQFLGAGEPEAARLARQEQVVRAALGGLPVGADAVRGVISALPGAPTGGALDSVVTVVTRVRAAGASDQLASTVLPVKDIDAGGAVVSYGLDSVAATATVDGRLTGIRLPVPPGGVVRVLVQNGVGTPGLSEAARARLLAADLRYVAGGNLPGFGQKTTVVLLRDASAQNRARGAAVAKALGLGESSLRISESAPTVAEVVVILGADFQPR
jgi:hypothetical protein